MVLLKSSGIVHDLFALNVLPHSSSTRSNVHDVHLRGAWWPVERVARRSHVFMATVTCHLALPGLLLLQCHVPWNIVLHEKGAHRYARTCSFGYQHLLNGQ